MSILQLYDKDLLFWLFVLIDPSRSLNKHQQATMKYRKKFKLSIQKSPVDMYYESKWSI